jgi:hypothetical protein
MDEASVDPSIQARTSAVTSHSADFAKRDRIVLNVVLAHVPIVGVLVALCGHLVIGLIIASVAAALCAAGYASARGTRLFRIYAGALLMVDWAAVIAASGVKTFLILYFDWLPIVWRPAPSRRMTQLRKSLGYKPLRVTDLLYMRTKNMRVRLTSPIDVLKPKLGCDIL